MSQNNTKLKSEKFTRPACGKQNLIKFASFLLDNQLRYTKRIKELIHKESKMHNESCDCKGREIRNKKFVKVDGTSFSDAGSLVTTVHLPREICPQDLNYRKSKTNMGAQKLLLTRCFFFPVCPRLD